MQYKSTLFASASLAVALAQSNSTNVPSQCSIASGTTATAQTDLDQYASCQTIAGDLIISGSLGNGALANVEHIQGSLVITNATSLVSFAADSLQTIDDSLTLEFLTLLDTASFGSLASVSNITFLTLPAVNTINTKLSSCNSVLISDTSLESIKGFEQLNHVQNFNINNNKQLVSIDSALQTVSQALEISFNGRQVEANFDSLLWANNLTLNDVSNASFASLSTINNSLGYVNNSLESIVLSNLTNVGGSLSVVFNSNLDELNFPALTAIGGALVVSNNTALTSITAFPQLSTIGGAVQFIGDYGYLTLPSLKSIKGGADIESTGSNFSCASLNSLQSKGAIQGDAFVCKGASSSLSVKLSGSSSATSARTSTAAGNGTTSAHTTKSKAGAAVAAPVSLFGALAAAALALL